MIRLLVALALKKTKDGLPKPFICTDEPIEEENLSQMPEKDKLHLWDIYEEIKEKPAKVLPELLRLKKKYPQVPCIYNYIGITYAFLKQKKEYFKILNETVKLFPDYLFGKICLAEYYLNHNKHQKVPAILDRKYQLHQHYPPGTNVFHISEVCSFYNVTGRYFTQSNKLARALFCYFTIEKIAPEHAAVKQLGNEIIEKEVEKVKRNYFKRYTGG